MLIYLYLSLFNVDSIRYHAYVILISFRYNQYSKVYTKNRYKKFFFNFLLNKNNKNVFGFYFN